jgi:hypothetical protein
MAQAPAQSETPAHNGNGAIDHVPHGWSVEHCGMARGVLYLTYIQRGKAAISPAFATPAIRLACSAAGYPVERTAGERLGLAQPARTKLGTAPILEPIRPRLAIEPTFVAQASDSTITVDGRNDGDRAYHCVLTLTWASDEGASRSVTTQATLPGRQMNRVFSSGPYHYIRFVRLTRQCSLSD